MALINFTDGERRGSVGGITYSRTRQGSVVRRKTSGVQPQTVLQTQVRAQMVGSSKSWGTDLDDSQRAGWETLALTVTLYNRFGDPYHPTGYNLFVTISNRFRLAGLTPLLDAPANFDVDVIDTLTIAEAFATLTEIILAWTPAITIGLYLKAELALNMQRGVSFVKQYYKLGDIVIAADTLTQTIDWSVRDLTTLKLGAELWVRLSIFNSVNGALSPSVVQHKTVVALP